MGFFLHADKHFFFMNYDVLVIYGIDNGSDKIMKRAKKKRMFKKVFKVKGNVRNG